MESKIIKYGTIFTFLGLLCLSNLSLEILASSSVKDQTTIRIAVLKDVEDFSITVKGKSQIIDAKMNSILKENRRALKDVKIKVVDKGIQIGENNFNLRNIKIVSAKDILLRYQSKEKRYRETIEIIKTKEGKLLVLNVVDLENYVRGVLYHEVTDRWPMEALKAQAVAVRTYALYRIAENKGAAYDVTSDIYSQVYGGKSAERYRTSRAVRKTAGLVLMYNGQILPAYFHSNCGGHTEDVSELWEQKLEPLKGVRCYFCVGMPNYNWKKNFRSQSVQEKLNQNGFSLGPIKTIKVLERNASGRIRKLLITTRDEKNVEIPGKQFRHIIGPNEIKSNNYEIIMQGYYFDVFGHGWGHGVGLCQWGAFAMAQKRYKYNEILNFYYPKTKLVDYVTGNLKE